MHSQSSCAPIKTLLAYLALDVNRQTWGLSPSATSETLGALLRPLGLPPGVVRTAPLFQSASQQSFPWSWTWPRGIAFQNRVVFERLCKRLRQKLSLWRKRRLASQGLTYPSGP